MDQNILSRLQQPTNVVAQAYTDRTSQLEAKREADAQKQQQAITQRDNDMLKVFEFAGDGRTEEAKFYANQKGLQVPDEVLRNADFAKGLTLAGKIYGDDPVAAQKFTTAWMQSGGGDFQSRLAMAQQAAGKVIDPADREYQRKIQFELWKQKNLPAGGNGSGGFSLAPGQTRYDAQGKQIASIPAQPPISRFEAGQRAAQAALQGGLASTDEVEAARQSAYASWDAEYGAKPPAGSGSVSQGLSGIPQGAPQAPQQPQIPSGLPQGSVMIGTANGRPVYQAPNGERFIEDGNP